MKTFKYKAAGAIYQNETGPEAQVGDQVRMQLDVASNPELPAELFGVIQPPIQKSGCCEDFTIYTIEYDESSLDGNLIRQDDVLEITVVPAVDVVAEDLAVEIAARIAADAAEAAARIAADIADRAYSIQRANHTGTQAQSTIVNLVSDLALKAPLLSPTLTTATLDGPTNGASGGTTINGIVSKGTSSLTQPFMASNELISALPVKTMVLTRVPKAISRTTTPTTFSEFTNFWIAPGRSNMSNDSSFWGRYYENGVVNGKMSYAGGSIYDPDNSIFGATVAWSSANSAWEATSLAGRVWRKNSGANLNDGVSWTLVTGTPLAGTATIILEIETILSGQIVSPSDATSKLLVASTTADQFWKIPSMGGSVYADDAAAAAGGVAVGDYYKKTGGTVAWRQA